MTQYNILPLNRSTMLCLWIISFTLIPFQQTAAMTSSMEYYHYNHQGSLLEVYDGASNQRLLSQAWSPWGERQILHAATGNANNTAALLAKGLPVHMGYTGHKELLSTGLTFAGDTRLYDARLKRFLNSDDRTTGGVRGQNRYSYAYNNPMTFIDPDGRAPSIVLGGWGRLTLRRSGDNSYNRWFAAAFTIQRYFREYKRKRFYAKNYQLDTILSSISPEALNTANILLARVDGLDTINQKDIADRLSPLRLNNGIEFSTLVPEYIRARARADRIYRKLVKGRHLSALFLRYRETNTLPARFESYVEGYKSIHQQWMEAYKNACIYGAILQASAQQNHQQYNNYCHSFKHRLLFRETITDWRLSNNMPPLYANSIYFSDHHAFFDWVRTDNDTIAISSTSDQIIERFISANFQRPIFELQLPPITY